MKSIKFYLVIVMVALLVIGGAYAGWHDFLSISGTVETGNIDVQFTDAVVCVDQDKDIAIVDAVVGPDGKSLEVTIDNAYPQLEGNVFFLVENFGTVPVHLETKVVYVSDNDALEIVNFGWGPGWPWCPPCPDDPDESCPPEEWLELPELEPGTQLGQDHTEAMGSVYFKVSNDAEMNSTYTFTIEYEFINWNESQH